MRVVFFLADAARVADGKLKALGIGWDRIVPGAPFVVCGTIGIPWHLAAESHTLRFDLIDGDGEPFCLPVEGDAEPVPFCPEMVGQALRDNIGPDVKPGSTLNWHFIVNRRYSQVTAGPQVTA
jgi:hypothetical protein